MTTTTRVRVKLEMMAGDGGYEFTILRVQIGVGWLGRNGRLRATRSPRLGPYLFGVAKSSGDWDWDTGIRAAWEQVMGGYFNKGSDRIVMRRLCKDLNYVGAVSDFLLHA